jgi:hypothetical protein
VQRHLAIALFAVLMGCADDTIRAPAPAMPVNVGSPDSEGFAGADGEETALAESEDPSESAPCAVSFTKDVMPKLVATCGSAACHKETTQPFVDDATPQITYESLRDFGFDDEAWTDPHPTESGLAEPSLAAAIDGWRTCGAPFE